MKKHLLQITICLATFILSLTFVWAINSAYSNFEARYPIPEPPPVPVIKPETYEPLPVMDYQPLHWPRLKNTRLAFPGEWLADEPEKSRREKWLGLYRTADGFEIQKTGMKIVWRTERITGQDGPYDQGYLKYDPEGIAKPLFVFKGIPGIKPGSAKTIFDNTPSVNSYDVMSIDACKGFDFWLNERYRLYSEDADSADDTCSGGKAVLSDGKTKQILSDSTNEMYFNFDDNLVIWIGDLDADGRPDMILDHGMTGCMYYHSFYVLYLSSQAKKGELVAPVAGFKT